MEPDGPSAEQPGSRRENVILAPQGPSPYESRILITLDRGVIVPWDFDNVDDGGLSAVSVQCEDGSVGYYTVDSPTTAEGFFPREARESKIFLESSVSRIKANPLAARLW